MTLQVHDEAFFSRVLARGDIGLAELYPTGNGISLTSRACSPCLHATAKGWPRRSMVPGGNSRRAHPPLVQRQQPHGQQTQHHGALRRQRLLPALAGPEHELLVRNLYRTEDDGSLFAAQHAKYRRILDQAGGPGRRTCPRNRLRVGGFAEMAVRDGLRVTGLDSVAGATALGDATRRRPTCAWKTTATQRRNTITSFPSKCSRPSAKMVAHLLPSPALPSARRASRHPEHHHP